MDWWLEIALVGLLAATLFYTLRLERALGVLKRDRTALEGLVNDFNSSTRAAEQGVERLRDAADGAGRQIARQVETAITLKDDLQFLADRGERLADRLDTLVRTARPLAPDPVPMPERAGYSDAEIVAPPEPRPRSQAERELMRALKLAR